MTDRLASIETASEAEVNELSQHFNATLHAHAATRQLGWFKFFQQMDDDGSGRIAYEELARGVREVLGLKNLPTAGLTIISGVRRWPCGLGGRSASALGRHGW